MTEITHIHDLSVAVLWDAESGRHVYASDVDIAFSADGILHVGEDYSGPSGRTISGSGMMAMPGLVDIHCHPFSEPMNKGMWDEIGSRKLYNSSLYEYLTVLHPDDEGIRACYGVALSELLLSGVTTLCDLSVRSDDWLDILAGSGLRAYVAPLYRSGRWFTRNGHTVEYEWDEAAGYKNLEAALAVIERARAHPCGRLSGMLAPAQIDTCTEALLKDSYREAERRDLPFQTHAAQSVVEFQEMTRRHGVTPIEWMNQIGVLGPRSIVGHGIFLDHHPWTHWPGTNDLDRLAEAGATVAHCPTVFARRGVALHDFGRYRRAGVNLAIGTDVYPHNMVEELRLAAYVARIVSGSFDTTAADVFMAATVGGAKALGRDDLGRLAPGAKADLVMVDCTHPMMRPCRDPLRSLVFSASERAIRHVFIDGAQVVRDGKVLTIDYEAASVALEEAQARAIERVPGLDWAKRTADELSPPSFPWLGGRSDWPWGTKESPRSR